VLAALLLCLAADAGRDDHASAVPVRTLDFAKVTLHDALSLDRKPVRIVFTVNTLPGPVGDAMFIETEGGEDAVRVVRLPGGVDSPFELGGRLTVEGVLRMRYWPGKEIDGEKFDGFREVEVVGASVPAERAR
jgi:hypothetical protein